MIPDWQRLQREVERVHARYHDEVVEALMLCPWAKEARKAGRAVLRISFMDHEDVACTLALVDAVMANATVEVGLLVFPALALDRLPFAHFVAQVRAAADLRHPASAAPFALADFHPNAQADTQSPERLVPFLRRAPDPMIQVVRTAALQGVRLSEQSGTSYVDIAQLNLASLLAQPSPTPTLAARVARNNAKTVEQLGVTNLDQRLVAILRDRDTSYAALGLTSPTWAGDSPSGANHKRMEKPDS